MHQGNSKKAPLIVALVLFAGLIVLVIFAKKSGGKSQPVPTVAPVAEPTSSVPSSPHNPAQDYTDDNFTFTDEMGDVVLSHNSYFYNQDITLKIYSRNAGTIRYTLDGSTPTVKSTVYSAETGIPLSAARGNDPKVYSVHAVVFHDDGTQSEEIIHSYLLSKGVDSRFENMMVVVISGDPKDLTDAPDGILFGLNYEQRGKASERPVYVEILNRAGALINAQKLGVRVNGAYNRRNSQKSLKFFARKKYSPESGTVYLNCFDLLSEDGTQIVRYDKFVLRAGGNDFRFAFCRDELNQLLAKEAGFEDYEPVFPAVAYMNGSYIGYFWLHGSYCDEFFKRRYGASPAEQASADGNFTEGEFVTIKGSDTHKKPDDDADAVEEQLVEEYNKAYAEFSSKNLTNNANYQALCRFMDVENYLDYMAYSIYLCNKDWPNNNVMCFRYVPAEGESYGEGVYDGRWRHLLHDLDYTLGLYGQDEVMNSYDTLKHVLKLDGDRHSDLFAALMERADCREYFIKKSLDYGAGALSYSSIASKLTSIVNSRSNEMKYYYDYLTSLRAEDVSWVNITQLEGNVEQILDFAKRRAERSADYLKYNFNLSGTRYNILIKGSEGARIRLNSYLAKEGADLSGVYFTDYATSVSAEYTAGKSFDYWEVNGKRVDTQTLKVTSKEVSNGSVTIVLHVKDVPLEQLIISGFRSRGDDYVTIQNLTGSAVDLSGYVLSDGTYEYHFESGDSIAAGETITVYGEETENAPADSRKAIFKLAEGEPLTLKDASGKTVDSVTVPNSHAGFVFKRNAYTGKFEEVNP
ncbi:MAG: CotH kinase family protein [Lachnospiraceae bacterium]|nr:CotH kinase family protein [Lachnospiraceae bacterium]